MVLPGHRRAPHPYILLYMLMLMFVTSKPYQFLFLFLFQEAREKISRSGGGEESATGASGGKEVERGVATGRNEQEKKSGKAISLSFVIPILK